MVEKIKRVYLEPKEREEARVVATQIWAVSMRVLKHEGERQLSPSGIMIWAEVPDRDSGNEDRPRSDLTIQRRVFSPATRTEVSKFNTDLGGHVMMTSLDPLTHNPAEEHEADAEELRNLFGEMIKNNGLEKEIRGAMTKDDHVREFFENLLK